MRLFQRRAHVEPRDPYVELISARELAERRVQVRSRGYRNLRLALEAEVLELRAELARRVMGKDPVRPQLRSRLASLEAELGRIRREVARAEAESAELRNEIKDLRREHYERGLVERGPTEPLDALRARVDALRAERALSRELGLDAGP